MTLFSCTHVVNYNTFAKLVTLSAFLKGVPSRMRNISTGLSRNFNF